MSSYSSLLRQLRDWEKRAAQYEADIRKYKRRKKEVEDLQKSLGTVAQNSAHDVNYQITNAERQLDSAVECPEKESRMDSIFSGKGEGNVDSDSNLSYVKQSFKREIDDCERKIESLEADLRFAENQIRSIEERMRDCEDD